MRSIHYRVKALQRITPFELFWGSAIIALCVKNPFGEICCKLHFMLILFCSVRKTQEMLKTFMAWGCRVVVTVFLFDCWDVLSGHEECCYAVFRDLGGCYTGRSLNCGCLPAQTNRAQLPASFIFWLCSLLQLTLLNQLKCLGCGDVPLNKVAVTLSGWAV